MAYGNGKSAVRLTRGVAPSGPTASQTIILQYPNPSFKTWRARFMLYHDFSVLVP